LVITEEQALDRSTQLVDALIDQLQRGGTPTRLVQTHISWVLLAGEFAWKIKKPVRFGFLDFSTLALRQRYCEEELRVNRRLAPALYLAVVPIRGTVEAPRLGNGAGEPDDEAHGEVIEFAVKMQRLPDDALASEELLREALSADDVVRFAQRLAAFHREAATPAPGNTYATPERIVAAALGPLAALPAGEPAAQGVDLARWFEAQAPLLAPLWTARRAHSRVRECHGDLHLDNVVRLGGELTAFDGIEFDDGLRFIDVLSDAGFLAMDLQAHRRPDLATVFLNAYLEVTGDYDGLPVLRFYMVYRAVVRAMVATLREAQGVRAPHALPAADYLALALRLTRQWDPRLLITHGLPGSGKSFVSQRVATACGAIRVRSDVERRRMLGSGRYAEVDSSAVYARLRAVAMSALEAGDPVVVDAACLQRGQRDALRAVAAAAKAPFAILDCTARDEVLRERVSARTAAGTDASEADTAVLDLLRERRVPLQPDELERTIRVDTEQPIATGAIAAAWLRMAPVGDEVDG
jgi:aminoglycoside phosphotransferase family enzyme/predicted kinase